MHNLNSPQQLLQRKSTTRVERLNSRHTLPRATQAPKFKPRASLSLNTLLQVPTCASYMP